MKLILCSIFFQDDEKNFLCEKKQNHGFVCKVSGDLAKNKTKLCVKVSGHRLANQVEASEEGVNCCEGGECLRVALIISRNLNH